MGCINCPYCDYSLGGQYCDKVGGKTLLYGYCTDTYSNTQIKEKHSKQKRRNKRERDQKYINHLKFLAEHCEWYPSPAVYMDKIYVKGQGYVENSKPYYKRYYRGQCSKYLKRMSNKAIRRYRGEIPKRGIGVIDYSIFGMNCIDGGLS